MIVDLDGGAPRSLANALTPAGGTWNRDGTILYVPVDSAGLFRIDEKGGGPQPVPLQSGTVIRVPQFLPDERHFLYFVPAEAQSGSVYVGSPDSDQNSRLVASDAPASYGSGHLWFVQQGTLLAQAFDPATRTLSGPLFLVTDDVAMDNISVGISTSASGSIAYRTGGSLGRRQLTWFDRSGKPLGTAGNNPPLYLGNPSLSADDSRVVLQATEQQNVDLYVLDVDRKVFNRLTLASGIDSMPVWSPDGTQIVFNSSGVKIRRLDGAGGDRAVNIPHETSRIATDWSNDDRFIMYKQLDATHGTFDLFAWPTDGKSAPVPVATTRYNERDGQFSPDGKSIAYQSDESGRPEIYIQPFQGPGSRVQVSTGGGRQVRWRRDGRELFYVTPDRQMMSVQMESPGPGQWRVGTPVPLFPTSIYTPAAAIHRQQYAVSRDGKRFLIATVDEASTAPITLMLNWKPGPRR